MGLGYTHTHAHTHMHMHMHIRTYPHKYEGLIHTHPRTREGLLSWKRSPPSNTASTFSLCEGEARFTPTHTCIHTFSYSAPSLTHSLTHRRDNLNTSSNERKESSPRTISFSRYPTWLSVEMTMRKVSSSGSSTSSGADMVEGDQE